MHYFALPNKFYIDNKIITYSTIKIHNHNHKQQ